MNHCEPDYRHFLMARTARTCSFMAVISALFSTIIFPYILGGLSIIFAVLSKGNTAGYQLNAKIAIWTAIFAMLGNTLYCGTVTYLFLFNDTYQEQLDATFEQIYGMDMQEYINTMFSDQNILPNP